jgi:predicted nucleic acid-binding protein
MNKRVFVDTSFIIAILNPKDQYNNIAQKLVKDLFQDHDVWISEAVLFELGNAFSKTNRDVVSRFISNLRRSPYVNIVWGNEALFQQALTLFTQHQDKNWSLTDCLSFIIMKENALTIAYSSDHHFEQAGFQYLLR